MDLDVVFPNRTDHYFPQDLLAYTEEGTFWTCHRVRRKCAG
uniref:Uncharacterized protein n=1 Tax=Medicago truncatula TaxID=3880 RepID=Q1S5L9_MEDTR|nr:hypothetical protein MtrDRAFT_AC147431g40v2 [Medicago truncatula]